MCCQKETHICVYVQELSGSRPAEVLESDVDATEWNLEVERVLPQLKVTIRTDNKVWLLTSVIYKHDSHALHIN